MQRYISRKRRLDINILIIFMLIQLFVYITIYIIIISRFYMANLAFVKMTFACRLNCFQSTSQEPRKVIAELLSQDAVLFNPLLQLSERLFDRIKVR